MGYLFLTHSQMGAQDVRWRGLRNEGSQGTADFGVALFFFSYKADRPWLKLDPMLPGLFHILGEVSLGILKLAPSPSGPELEGGSGCGTSDCETNFQWAFVGTLQVTDRDMDC